jgi:hypothetical protein
MPAGLQIFDGSSNILLDTSTSISRHTGTSDIGPSPATGTISVPGWATGANVYYIPMYSVGTLGHPPNPFDFGLGAYTVSGGNTINWETYAATKIVYGVY